MGIAAFLATALMVGASGAWHLLRGDRSPAVKKMFAMAMGMLLLVAPLQAVVGDVHGLNTLKHQPAKVAAMEGHWENEPGAGVPLTLFGLPDMDKEETRYALNIPRLGSLILTHSWDGQFPGLKSYPAADRPNVPVVFWSFRVMVGLGLLMIALAIWALWTLARPAVRIPRAATLRAVDGTLWTDRHAGRLVCHRSGPPALGGVRRDAHGRCGHAARVGRADADAGAFRGGIPAGVRRRRVLHAAPDPHGSHARPGHAPLSGGPGEPRQPSRPCPPPPPAPACRRKPRIREHEMGIDLALIWAVIILFGIMMYVIMDGFDLGIGILFPLVSDPGERDVMVNTVAPVWDGNETWLVLGGAGLMAAFPLAYSVILHALHLPLVFMLLGLIFRGVAFEFRFKADERHRPLWDRAFVLGSICATFFQGVALGAYIEGIPVVGRVYQGGPWDWISPFSLFTGAGLVAAYALLGCTWLIMKTEGALQRRMCRAAKPLTLALLAVIAALSLWTPLAQPQIAQRWFSLPNMFWFLPVPLLVAAAGFDLIRRVRGAPAAGPFLLSLGLVFLGYSGLGISIWPAIIPPDVSIWTAAAPPQSLGFALVGALAIIPVILMYTAWSYYVFRGKVRAGEGYH